VNTGRILCLSALLVAIFGCASTATGNISSLHDMDTAIHQLVPIGTDAEKAQKTMEGQGFRLDTTYDKGNPPASGEPLSHERTLVYTRSDDPQAIVPHWIVFLGIDREVISAVSVRELRATH